VSLGDEKVFIFLIGLKGQDKIQLDYHSHKCWQ